MKDDEPFAAIGATLEKAALPGGKTSLIIGDTFDILRATGAHADKIVDILTAQFAETGATHGQLKKAFVADAGNSASSFNRAWRDLKETERVRIDETGPRPRYYPAKKD
jgi:phage-related minor tail protein